MSLYYLDRSLSGDVTIHKPSPLIDSVQQAIQVTCHHGDTQTIKPTKRDGRVVALITPLHNAGKGSADTPIGKNLKKHFIFKNSFREYGMHAAQRDSHQYKANIP